MADIISAADAAKETFNSLLNLVSGALKEGLLTGFEQFDACTCGFHPGTITMLASLPFSGKSAFALNLARSMFHQAPAPSILYCSADLDHIQLMTRLLCMECGWENAKIQQGDFEPGCFEKMKPSAAEWLRKLPLWIDGTCNGCPEEMLRKIRRFLRKNAVDLLIVDPLELLRTRETFSAVKSIRQLAREFQLPVLILSSCRECTLQALPEGVAENSDTVMFLKRGRRRKKEFFELEISRNCCGFTGTIPMEYDPKTMIFNEKGQKESEK